MHPDQIGWLARFMLVRFTLLPRGAAHFVGTSAVDVLACCSPVVPRSTTTASTTQATYGPPGCPTLTDTCRVVGAKWNTSDPRNGMELPAGMEWNGMEWNGMEWNGAATGDGPTTGVVHAAFLFGSSMGCDGLLDPGQPSGRSFSTPKLTGDEQQHAQAREVRRRPPLEGRWRPVSYRAGK